MTPEQGAIPFPYIMLAIFFIFYFLVIRPEKKKQNEIKEMRNTLKKNDKVITAGGIYGTVSLVKDDRVVIRVDDNTKIEFDKQSVTPVANKKIQQNSSCPYK